MSKPVSSTYRGAPGKLTPRSPLTTRSLAWARVITAPRPPRSLAARSGISGRPIRPGRPPSRDDAAPSLAGQRSDRPARVWLPARRLPRSLPPAAAARGPRPCCVLTPDHGGWHPGVAGVPAVAKTFLPGRIRQGPSMYEMEGPCPASPHRLASWLVFAGAARRPPGPGTRARGRSPGSSHVPGVAPGWCPFPAVKAFLLPPQAPRKALRPVISCFSAIHEGIHRNRQLSAFHSGYPRVYSQPAHRLPDVSRRTPEPLPSHAIADRFTATSG